MTIFEVADWFLHKKSMTHKQIQKLCYYAQAWHLALLNQPLFEEEMQAWIHGPVCPQLYQKYHGYGWQEIEKRSGKSPDFPKKTLQVLNSVYDTYGKLDGAQLEALTHSEMPWQKARGGLSPLEPSTEAIKHKDMREYYVKAYEAAQGD